LSQIEKNSQEGIAGRGQPCDDEGFIDAFERSYAAGGGGRGTFIVPTN
jgi:hypothetical protein